MGDVKDAIKGPAKSTPSATTKNLLGRMEDLYTEVSDLVIKKDTDTISEGKDAMPENVRKAASLRSVATLLGAAKRLLEDY